MNSWRLSVNRSEIYKLQVLGGGPYFSEFYFQESQSYRVHTVKIREKNLLMLLVWAGGREIILKCAQIILFLTRFALQTNTQNYFYQNLINRILLMLNQSWGRKTLSPSLLISPKGEKTEKHVCRSHPRSTGSLKGQTYHRTIECLSYSHMLLYRQNCT